MAKKQPDTAIQKPEQNKKSPAKAQRKKMLLAALEKSFGVVTTACQHTGIDRQTFYNYYNDDPAFAKKVDELKNVALDYAESHLFKNMQDGKEASVIFYLKTQGKGRGYIEKVQNEHTGSNGGPIQFADTIDLSKLSDQELIALKAIQAKLGTPEAGANGSR